jgi:meiotically up-regulated gene 157 (Mug157) protein
MRQTGLRSEALESAIADLDPVLRPEGLADLFADALRCTLETTITLEDDGAAFAITGDIPAMWLRHSSGQVLPYLRFCASDTLLRQVVRGMILRQARCILDDPYANAFTRDPSGRFALELDETEQRPGVWERKWEVDSLCWPLRLLRGYVAATGDLTVYAEPDVRAALGAILRTFETEREHTTRSTYSFRRPLIGILFHDTANSHLVAPTGMIWGAFRPSDDGCVYNYHIPSQMLAVVELTELAHAFDEIYRAARWAERTQELAATIEDGIQRYGVVDHTQAGPMYAYEVDGLGHYLLVDDANLPSLLGIPEIGYRPAGDPVYHNTRSFALSQANPYYYQGTHAAGIGSPHTPAPYVWPLALIVQALTSTAQEEVYALLQTLRATHGGHGHILESFDPNDPTRHTRGWFAWGNALFAELVLRAYYDA